MTIAEISVQSTSDPNAKVYHTRFELSSGPESGIRGASAEVGEFGNLVLDIRGVVQVAVCPYVMLVTKAPLFEWGEIDPRVEDLLRGFAVSQHLLEEDFGEQISGGPGVEGHPPPDPRIARQARLRHGPSQN